VRYWYSVRSISVVPVTSCIFLQPNVFLYEVVVRSTWYSETLYTLSLRVLSGEYKYFLSLERGTKSKKILKIYIQFSTMKTKNIFKSFKYLRIIRRFLSPEHIYLSIEQDRTGRKDSYNQSHLFILLSTTIMVNNLALISCNNNSYNPFWSFPPNYWDLSYIFKF
jgi:hypothetical protein